MKLGRQLHRLYRSVMRWGTSDQTGFRRRETILVNQLCLIAVGATVFYHSLFIMLGMRHTWQLQALSVVFLIGHLTALGANARGHTILARNLAMAVASFQLLSFTYLLGNDTGLHLYYFALAGLASMIHTRVRADVTFTLALVFAALFVVCEFALDSASAPIAPTPAWQRTFFTVSVLGTIFLCAYSAFVYRLAMFHGERELAQANRELAELSGSDALTRLANRRRMEERLNDQWRRLSRARLPLSLLMIDADQFKAYNDRYGHQAGDECLRRIACLATACMKRASDTVARYGGEEFIAILPETNRETALSLAEQLRAAVESTDMRDESAESPGGECITVSIGVSTTVPGDDSTPEVLISNADRALYEAKLHGRNCVVFCAGRDQPGAQAAPRSGEG